MIPPKTKLGKWSVGLILAMPVLFFIGALSVNLFYQGVPAEGTILGDMTLRPMLAVPMLMGVISGIAAFITGLVSVTKYRDRALLVFVPIIIGGLLTLFVVGEFLFPD